jgi:uncharacterized protein (TIGR02453 family)
VIKNFRDSETLFQGFSPKILRFFHNLERNNNRDWFLEHRDDYDVHVAEPVKRLVLELVPMVQELDSQIVTEPRRIISRIHRDTRFSNDKTPYRPRVWIAFKRNVESWMLTPAYFFQVQEKDYWFGMGMYADQPATMQRFRRMIDSDPERFLQVIEPIRKNKSLKLEPNRYKRLFPCSHSKAIDAWYQNKSIAVYATREPDKTLFSSKLPDFLMERFVLLKPLYDFLWKAVVLN